jgi:hypothetical protein
MDPHSIGRLDPDPGGLKRAKMKRKKSSQNTVIRHKKYKNHCNWYKNVICDLFLLKFNIFFTLTTFLFFNVQYIQEPDPQSFSKLDTDPHSPKKLDSDPHKVNADSKHWKEGHCRKKCRN